MQFTYKIENYYPYESRVFVIYTPVDTNYDTLGGWVGIKEGDTEAQIHAAVIAQAPHDKWAMVQSVAVQALIGIETTVTAEAPTPPGPEVPTIELTKVKLSAEIQKRLDDFAKTRRYKNIDTLASYEGDSDSVFNAEGTYGKLMRGLTWRAAGTIEAQIEAEVIAGTRTLPVVYADIEALLPDLIWPL